MPDGCVWRSPGPIEIYAFYVYCIVYGMYCMEWDLGSNGFVMFNFDFAIQKGV